MKVEKLPKDNGIAGWNAILPKRNPTLKLGANRTADWLVIGAGFAGLSAARRLSQLRPTDRVIILEAGAVAEGPAGRNSGFMIDLPHDLTSDDYGGAVEADKAQIEDNRRGIQFAREIADEYELSKEAFDPCGKFNAAATEKGTKHNLDFAGHLDALNESYEVLDAKDLHQLTGTTYYNHGIYCPGTVVIQPAQYIRGLAAGVQSENVVLHEHSPVIALNKTKNWTAETPAGRVEAPNVILAVNGHLNSFGFLKRRIMHVFTYASMTMPLSETDLKELGGKSSWGITPADPLGSSVRRISGVGGDRIVVRNRFTFNPSMEESKWALRKIYADHDWSFRCRFPMLESIRMQYRWGGRLAVTRENVQAIGKLEEGLYSACIQNGLGTAKGTLAGVLAAELACGIASPALDRALAAPKPKRLPPGPLAKFGANAHIRFGEWRAGREL